tara:strand:- start:286 stop:1377 length:1092 start_codon:yes stop_codon:yes gene_type:complete
MIKALDSLYSYLKYLGYEKAHTAMTYGLRALSYRPAKPPADERLIQNLWGREILSPIGLGAGFDKNAIATGGYFHLGFGLVEMGTVTSADEGKGHIPKYTANIDNQSVRYRKSLPSVGYGVFGRRLAAYRLGGSNTWGLVGVNIGVSEDDQNPIEGFQKGVAALGGMVDFIVLNLEGIMTNTMFREESLKQLEILIEQVMAEREEIPERLPAVLIKLPLNLPRDLVADLAEIFKNNEVNGVIIGDALPMELVQKNGQDVMPGERLAGAPLKKRALQMVRVFHQYLGDDVTIVGSGGIMSGKDAYDFIKAGASLVQICSALILKGPGVALQITSELSECLDKDGYETISQAVGAAARAESVTGI